MSGHPVTDDSVFRIEVSLSSRKSSAIVMRTHARLYTLERAQEQATPTSNAQWRSVAYGAPCIQLMRETTEHNSPFHIKVVIAEVESGISLWEAELSESCGYNAMQTNFHTFSSEGKTFAIQFANESEGQRMLESIHDLFLQKQKAETVAFEKKPDQAIFKKPKSFRRLNKKDISTPCNFKHVSGITVQRTQVCEDELRGTIQRKMRSMSLSSLVTRRPKYSESDNDLTSVSPAVRREEKSSKSLLNRFGSLRAIKKRGVEDDHRELSRDDKRMSLPSHYRKQARPSLNTSTFSPTTKGSGPNQSLSHSSGDLASMPVKSSSHHPSGSNLERRHTIVVDHQSPGRVPYNYVPYSKAGGQSGNSPRHTVPRQYSSDVQLNRAHPSAAPPHTSEVGMAPIPSGSVPPPAQLTKSRDLHYQVPQAKMNPRPTYQSPLPNSYQVPTKKYQAPMTRDGTYYQVPQSQPEAANRAIPYAVVGVGSIPGSMSGRPREVVQHNAYDVLSSHNQLPPQQYQLTKSMSPVFKPPEDISPSHTKSQVAPPPAQPRGQHAFVVENQAPYNALSAAKTRNSLASQSSTSVSTQDHLTEVMDVMDKALEQFDSLLQNPQEQKQIIQTAL